MKMSDERRIIIAKRGNDRKLQVIVPPGQNPNPKVSCEDKQGTKRQIQDTSTAKNFANDRLKKLRTHLNEEVKQVKTQQQKRQSNKSRKKKSDGNVTQILPKLIKSNSGEAKGNAAGSSRSPFKFDNPQHIDFGVFKNTSNDNEMEWSPCDELSQNQAKVSSDDLFIVVDTNIFLSHLCLIKDIISMKIDGPGKPVVYIPWIVIEELDFIKDGTSNSVLKRKAQEAIKYINQLLGSNNPRIKGQTLEEVNAQSYCGKSQDNKIISCCNLISKNHTNMVLLTNDINLRNKAHINNIPVSVHNEILTKINTNYRHVSKQKYILDKMCILCNSVIKHCAMKAYGDVWSKMKGFKTSPKTLKDCIKLFKQYWFPVFQQDLMKQFKKTIEELDNFLSRNSDIQDDSDLIDDLLKLCIRVCLFLKDIQSCRNFIENTIKELGVIKES